MLNIIFLSLFIIPILVIYVIYRIQWHFYKRFFNDLQAKHPNAYRKQYKTFFIEWAYLRLIMPSVYTHIIKQYNLQGESLVIAKKGRFWARVYLSSYLFLFVYVVLIFIIFDTISM